jgi:hypothetical protein
MVLPAHWIFLKRLSLFFRVIQDIFLPLGEIFCIMGTLLLNASKLELDGHALHPGDGLELWIFGSWISGTLIYDHTGWSLLTTKHVRLRLSQGLPARILPSRLHEGGANFHSTVQEMGWA